MVTMTTSPSNGQQTHALKLMQVLQQPKVSIEIYDFGVMMRTPTQCIAVDPAQVAKLLMEKRPEPAFNTGLIRDDILQIYERGDKRIVFSYRKPQMTGIWLEGQKDALSVPMPGLILARRTGLATTYHSNTYAIVAVKRRPQPGSQVFAAPLPNSNSSGICWGTVAKPRTEHTGVDMRDDWSTFLGSHFNSHDVGNKSVKFPKDVRDLLKKLHADKAKRFPKSEYVALNSQKKTTFKEWAQRIIS